MKNTRKKGEQNENYDVSMVEEVQKIVITLSNFFNKKIASKVTRCCCTGVNSFFENNHFILTFFLQILFCSRQNIDIRIERILSLIQITP